MFHRLWRFLFGAKPNKAVQPEPLQVGNQVLVQDHRGRFITGLVEAVLDTGIFINHIRVFRNWEGVLGNQNSVYLEPEIPMYFDRDVVVAILKGNPDV